MASIGSYIGMLGPHLVELFRKIRKSGLAGPDVSLGVGFEVSKDLCRSQHGSLLASCGLRCALSAVAPET